MKLMRVTIKGYYDCAFTDIPVNKSIDWSVVEYMRFSSRESSKVMFHFYKEEMQQGNSPMQPSGGYSVLKATGFYDVGFTSWKQFQSFNPHIIYKYKIIDKKYVELEPIHVNENYKIDTNKIVDL